MSTGTVSATIWWKAKLKQAILVTQAANLLALWGLGDTQGEVDVETQAADLSGNDRGGVHSADVKLGIWGVGDGDLCACYEGNAHTAIYSANLASAFNELLGSLTLALRIPLSGTLTDSTLRVLARLAADASNEIVIYKDTTNNTLGARYEAGGTSKAQTFTIADTLPHYVTITWNVASDRVRVYLDGSQEGSDLTGLGTWVGALAAAACCLGASDTSNTNPYKGFLQCVGLHDCELTATEVANIHNHLTRFDNVLLDADRIQYRRGFARKYDPVARVGTATLTLDNGFTNQHGILGLYSPTNANSPLYGCLAPHPGQPLRRVQVTETFGGTEHEIFSGWIVNVKPVGRSREIQIKCVDALHAIATSDYIGELMEDVRSDQAVAQVLNSIGPTWAAEDDGYLWIEILGLAEIGFAKISSGIDGMTLQTGEATFDFLGDTWIGKKTNAMRVMQEIVAAEGGRLFAQADGTLKMTNRWHEFNDHAAAAAVSGTMVDVQLDKDMTDTYTEVAVTIQPRVEGTPGTVLGTLQAPVKIDRGSAKNPNKTQTVIDLSYRDPDTGHLFGAKDVIDPVEHTDWETNKQEDGGGDSANEYLWIAARHMGAYSRYWCHRKQKKPKFYLTFLQVRGTPLIVYDKQTHVAREPSLAPRRVSYDLKVGNDANFARGLAWLRLGELREPSIEPVVTLENHSDAIFTQMLTRDVFDLVHLEETEQGIDGDYRILQIDGEIRGAYHNVRWNCIPYNYAGYMVIDQGRIDYERIAPF